MKPQAPQGATGADQLIVRPREQARAGLESILQFLVPGKTPTRTPQDIFIIADAPEEEAKGLLAKNRQFILGLALLLAVVSVWLILKGRIA